MTRLERIESQLKSYPELSWSLREEIEWLIAEVKRYANTYSEEAFRLAKAEGENLWLSLGDAEGFAREAKALSEINIKLIDQNKKLRAALLMVLGSTLMEADGHNWQTCNQPSCAFARQALSEIGEKE